MSTDSSPEPLSFQDIEAAAGRLCGHIVATPFLHSRTLSHITGSEIWLKFENLQYTASFKERGALNKLATLSAKQRQQGVIAMSAGNHAQGVAYHSHRLGIPSTIVMPKGTPFVKIDNTRRLGAEVVLSGETVDDAAHYARKLAAERDLCFVHPYDDPLIIAGQGTIGLEIAESVDLDAVIVPIGGGGLISGIALALKGKGNSADIIGVQSEAFPAVYAMRKSCPSPPNVGTIADGIAVREPGQLTTKIISELVTDIVLVSEADIERSILAMLEVEKTVVEGAGAAGLAAVLNDRQRFSGKRLGLILCGGNIDSRLLSAVLIRGLVRSDRLIRFMVSTSDRPGSLAVLTAIIGEAGGNIVDVRHQRAFSEHSVREAIVDFTIETRNLEHALDIRQALEAAGYGVKTASK